jgi:hypothetical protein
MRPKPPVPPPSPRITEAFQKYLKQCLYIEHAATLAGVSKKTLSQWLILGRQGRPGFTAFVDMIDQANAKLAAQVLDPIVQAAEAGNVNAAQWLYKQRFGKREDHYTQKILDIEDKIEAEESSTAELAPEDIAAAEQRALEAAEAEVRH